MQNTPVREIDSAFQDLKASFKSRETFTLEWRLTHLERLKTALQKHEATYAEGCKEDLGRGPFDAYLEL